MKTSAVLCIGAASIVLAACASQPEYTAEKVNGMQVCNADVTAKVEQDAKKNDRQVIWGSCPTWTLRPT